MGKNTYIYEIKEVGSKEPAIETLVFCEESEEDAAAACNYSISVRYPNTYVVAELVNTREGCEKSPDNGNNGMVL